MAQKKPQPAKSKYELWKETVEDGVSNGSWDVYDTTIKLEVAEYNTRLSGTPGYKKVDWQLIKRVVSGWRTFDTATIAARYNGGGDDRYAEKFDYVLALFARLKRS